MLNLKRMLEIQHQNNKNKKEILKKIKKIDKELNLERVFPVGYRDIEIVSFEITGNDITGKKSLGIYYSAAIEDSYGVFDSIYSYATIDLDIFLLRDTEIEALAKEADQKKKLPWSEEGFVVRAVELTNFTEIWLGWKTVSNKADYLSAPDFLSDKSEEALIKEMEELKNK